MKRIASTFFFVLLSSAQTFQGSLRGRIIDPNGAAVGSVRVTLTDQATALLRSTVSNDTGEYVFPSLTPATYTVIAEAVGFKRLERRGVTVSTQAALTLDLSLELGQVTEQVNVTAETPQLEASDASTGQVLDSKRSRICRFSAAIRSTWQSWLRTSFLPEIRSLLECRTKMRTRRCPSPEGRCEQITISSMESPSPIRQIEPSLFRHRKRSRS